MHHTDYLEIKPVVSPANFIFTHRIIAPAIFFGHSFVDHNTAKRISQAGEAASFYELYAKRFKEIFVCAEININTLFDKTILCFNREKIKRNASAGRSCAVPAESTCGLLCTSSLKARILLVRSLFELAATVSTWSLLNPRSLLRRKSICP